MSVKKSEIIERIKEPTPKFFKKVRGWALFVAIVATAASPVLSAVGFATAAAIAAGVAAGASGAAAVAQTASTERQ